MSRRFVVAALIVLAPATARAEVMSGAQLQATFAGKTIYLSAPFGSLPIRYSSGGSMVAQSRAMQVFSGYYKDTGTWRISGNRLCQRWNIWLKGKEQCFSVSRSGSVMRWTSNDGMSGTATAAK